MAQAKRRRGQAAAPAGGPTLYQLAADPLGEIAAEVGADLVTDGSCEGLSESLAQANLTEALAKDQGDSD